MPQLAGEEACGFHGLYTAGRGNLCLAFLAQMEVPVDNPASDSHSSVALRIAGQETEMQGSVSPFRLDLGPLALLWCEAGF